MEFAPLTQEYHKQWAELLAICFERSPEDMLALLEWLQKMGHVVGWGAWDGSKLVAQYTSLLRQLCQNDVTFLAGMSINMAVHPDYRGRGLIKHVSAPVYEEIERCKALFGFGFSNAEGVKVDKRSKGYGYQVLGRLQSYLTVLPKIDADAVHLSDILPSNKVYLSDDVDNEKLHFKKSLNTFRVRYGEHPFRDYRYGVAYDNGNSEGIVVYRDTVHFGIHGVSLMDAYGNNLPDLLRRWGSTLKRHGYHFIHTLATPQSTISRSLTQASQTLIIPYSRNPHYLTLRPINPSLSDEVNNFEAWDFIGGDIL